jgi:hypothetical protein
MLDWNLFRWISLIMAGAGLIKVFFGIFYHDSLYRWAKSEYGREKRSSAVNLLLVYALLLLGLVWYATLTQYVPGGWVLTLFITSASIKSIGILFHWQAVSEKFADFVLKAGKKLWLVDLFVGCLVVFFLYMGFYVY